MAKKTPNTNTQTQSNSPIPALILILIATLFVYFPSLQNGFITSWDDNHFVTENPAITSISLENIKAIFSNTLLNMYSPLTTLSLAFDYALWDLKPFGYHLTNLIFHLLNTALVFVVFSKITNKSWLVLFVSALFALHPMHVESVAWISERKDVLYSFFYLSAIVTYFKFTELKQSKYFIYTIILFILSCLAKPMAITLPVILGLIYWYKSEKSFEIKDYAYCIGLAFISIVFVLMPFIFHDTSTLTDNLSLKFSIVDRVFLLTYAIAFYFIKLILPIQQSAFHYYPEKINDLLPNTYYASAIIIALFGLLIWKIKSLSKELIFSLVFFFVSIVLVLKIVPFGNAVVAERYTYLPYLGLFFGLGILLEKFIKADSTKTIILIAVSVVFAITSFTRQKVWKSNLTLFTDIIAKYPEISTPYNIRGDVYSKDGNTLAALNDYNKSIELDPDNYESYVNRGVIYFNTNQFELAVNDYNIAAKLNKETTKIFLNRGISLMKLNRFEEAIPDFERVVKAEPNNAEAIASIGFCYYNLKNYELALSNYDKAISLNPNDFETLKNRGNAKAFLKDFKGSIEDYSTIIKNNPNDANALSNRGNSYYQSQQVDKACEDWKIAAQLGNANAIGAVKAICR